MFHPERYGIIGKYSVGFVSGAIAATPLANNSEMANFRWSASTGALMGVRRLRLGLALDGPVFTAFTACRLAVYKATAFTGNATANNTDIDPGTGGKRQPTMGSPALTMPTSLVGANDFQIMTTAGMTGMTRTLDAQPLSVVLGEATNAASGAPLYPTYVLEPPVGEDYAAIFAQDEGIVVKNIAAFAATGVTALYGQIEWDEIQGM